MVEVFALKEILALHEERPGQREAAVQVEIVATAGSYVRRPPFRAVLDELADGHRQLADTYFRKTEQAYAEISHIRLRDALVVGQGAIITATGCLVRESVLEFLAHSRIPDGLELIGDGEFGLTSEQTVHVRLPTLLLKRPWYRNYGHWLVDCASIAALAGSLTMPANWQVAVGRQSSGSMRRIVFETLALLLPGVPIIEIDDDVPMAFDELHYVTPVHVPPLFKLPSAISALRAITLRDQLGFSSPRRAIYVRRNPKSNRSIANEEALLDLCDELGIDTFEPEGMGFVAQARVFHDAKLVLGVKGAGLTNAMFCSPRSHVVAMSPNDFPDPFFWDLVSQHGIGYSEIFSPPKIAGAGQGQSSFAVNINDVREAMQKCLQSLEI